MRAGVSPACEYGVPSRAPGDRESAQRHSERVVPERANVRQLKVCCSPNQFSFIPAGSKWSPSPIHSSSDSDTPQATDP